MKTISQNVLIVRFPVIVNTCSLKFGAVESAGLSWPLPEGISEAQLRHLLFPDPDLSQTEPKVPPDFALLHEELKRKGVTRYLLWEEHLILTTRRLGSSAILMMDFSIS